MADLTYTCRHCFSQFSVKPEIVARFPGWTPSVCLKCRDAAKREEDTASGKPASAKPAKKKRPAARKKVKKELNLPLAKVLERFTEGPLEGVFTDGACSKNPGPGGWGVVWVRDNEVVDQRYGHAASTTNNRMELKALIEAYRMLPEDEEVTLWSDSNLCVRTINEWAAGWKRLGWKRKTGPVENLELVQEAYELSLSRPRATLRWIKAHNGSRWNEYADALATAYARDEL